MVIKCGAAARVFYFKASPAGGVQEPQLVKLLSSRWPEWVPTPVAIDGERGWMLVPHAGEPMCDQTDTANMLPLWKEVIGRYARMQVALGSEREALSAVGLPDRGMQRLPHLLTELLANEPAICLGMPDGVSVSERDEMLLALPFLEQQCARITAAGIPESLDHGDLHDGNVLIEGDTLRVIDWGDAVITHPICSLVVTLTTIQGWQQVDWQAPQAIDLRDTYLQEWTHLAPLPALQQLFPTSMWIGHLTRALDWDHVLRNASDEARKPYQHFAALWLKRWHTQRSAFNP
jgi:hypothetical protein